MSAEAFTPTEQDVGVHQEESKSLMEYGSDIEQIKDNDVELTESDSSVGADDTLDQSAVTNADIRPPQQRSQEDVATGGTGTKDSQESSVSGGACGSESQQAGSDSNMVTQLGDGIGTESHQGGETVAVDRQLSQESRTSTSGSSTESQEGSVNGTESQLPGAVGSTISQNSQGNNTDGSSGNGNSFEAAADFGASVQTSLSSGVAGDVSNSLDIMGNSAGTDSFAVVAVPGSRSRLRQKVEGVAQETEELTRSCSLSSGVAGDVSNSPDTIGNSAGSFAVISEPGPRDRFRQNEEERAQQTADLMRGYDQCFNKCACICDYMRPCSIRIRKSKIFMFLKTLLLVIPISAFYMGLNYLSGCPAAGELPIFMMLMGVSGAILLVSSLGLDSRHTLCPSVRPIYFRTLIMASRIMLFGVFAAGLDRTYTMSPSFDSSDQEKYCNEVFYNYAYYTNFVVIGIAVLSFFIYVPSFNENIEGYEHL